MAAVYPSALEQLLQSLDLSAVTVKVLAVDSDYTYSAAHDFLDDVAGAARLGTAVTLAGKTYTSGLFSASAITYTGVAVGETIKGLIFYVDTGVEATSRLIAFDDQNADGSPMNFAGTGAGIPISWPNGIFSI